MAPGRAGRRRPCPSSSPRGPAAGNERGDLSIHGPPKILVDSAQRSIGSPLPFADVVINDDLVPPAYPCGQSSRVHFDAAALREQGSRFHTAPERVRERYVADR